MNLRKVPMSKQFIDAVGNFSQDLIVCSPQKLLHIDQNNNLFLISLSTLITC